MSELSAASVGGYPTSGEGPGSGSISPETRAFNASVTAAVRQLNEAGYAGEGREVSFSFDPASREPVVRVIDIETKEVVTQLPPKYVLDLADDYYSQTKDS